MAEWQPIETAPMDGTIVFLWGGEDDNAIFAEDRYKAFCHAPCRAMFDRDAWLMALAEAGYVGVIYRHPTHWMPLPDPPSPQPDPQGAVNG